MRPKKTEGSDQVNRYYSAVILFAVLTMAMLAVMIWRNEALAKKKKYGMVLAAVLIIVSAVCEYLGVRMTGAPAKWRVLHSLVKFLEFSAAPASGVVFAGSVFPLRGKRWIRLALVLHAALELLSMFRGIVFFVDADNVYMHCRFYAVYSLAYALSILLVIVQCVRFMLLHQNRNKLGLVMISLFVLLGIEWQFFDGGTKVVWLSVAIGYVFFYIYYCDILQQTDKLTGLLNRRSYENRLVLERKPVWVLMADVDEFKEVNDKKGHHFGDVCLSRIGEALKSTYGRYGLCYRIGGDEFCVILHRVDAPREDLRELFEAKLEEARRADPDFPFVSVGCTRFDPKETTLEGAAIQADLIMYECKQRAKREREKNKIR